MPCQLPPHFWLHKSLNLCSSVNQQIKSVCHRIARLEEGPFKPIGDERDSEETVNKLLIAGFTVPILASIAQTGLAYLYFRFGHAWSQLLQKYGGTTPAGEHQAGTNGRPLQSTPASPQPHPRQLPEEDNSSKRGSDDGSPDEKDECEGGHQTSSEGQRVGDSMALTYFGPFFDPIFSPIFGQIFGPFF